MKKLILYTALLFMAGEILASNAYPALTLTTSVRADAMGGIVSSFNQEVDGIYANPSALKDIRSSQFYGVYLARPEGAYHTYLTYASPLDKKSSFALSIGMLNGGPIEINSFLGTTETKTAQLDAVFGISYGRSFNKDIAIGATLKGLYSSLAETYTSYGFCLDLGAKYSTFEEIAFSLSVLNLGIATKYINEADPLPLTFLVGITYPLKLDKENIICAGVTEEYALNEKFKTNIGAEYSYQNIIFVRAGYRINQDAGNITAGVGLRQDVKNFGTIGVDFAYLYGNDWFDAYKFAITLKY